MAGMQTVDAVSVAPSAAGTAIKLDTSGMAEALQKMAEAQMAEQMKNFASRPQIINPAATIKTVGDRMVDLYSRYEKLQEIGRPLNGIPVSDPIPEALRIEDITITFRTKEEDGSLSDYKTASVKNVICTGDIYKLLSGEMGVIILSMEQETKALLDVAQRAEGQYGKARKQWETANPDRQIKQIDGAAVQP